MESEFLFQSETRELVHPLLRLLYTQIVESGEVFIEIDSSNIIATKLFSMPQEPALVEPYDVPILTINYSILSSLSWDITIRHVLQFIDGDNTISEIASTYPGMDINIVKRAIRTLLHYKCIYITDKLKFTNIYELSDHGQEFIIFLLQLQQQQHERMTSELNSSISVGMNGMSYMNGDITSHEHDHYHQNESPLRTIINTTTATTTTNTYDGVNQSSNIPTSNITTTNMSNNIDDNCIKTASQSQSQLGLGLQKLIQYCSLQNDDKTSSTIIFTLLTQFRPNRQLSEVLMYLRSQVPIFKINIRKFISYCIHHRMLFRIHEYPINLANQDSGTIFTYDVAPSDRHIATTTAATTATTNQPYMHTTSSTGNNYTDRNETPTGTTSYLNTNNLGGLSHNHLKSTSSMKPSNQTQHTRTETISIILNGKEHMDSICCKYKINHKVILSKPGVTVIYK